MTDAPLPLSRLTVLDLTRARAGPTAVRQFADWGAHVIKIEAPGDADPRGVNAKRRLGPDFWNLHRNKRSITLNLKTDAAREIFFKLVETADVIIENYRPAVKDRLGIGYAACKAVNPRIVYGSISGFGQTGPYRDRPGVDQIAQGMGGLMSITGLPGQGPVRVGIPIADLTTGMYLAIGLLTAVYEREITGEGRWVHTSLLEAEIAMLDYQVTRWTMAGEVPPQAGNNHPIASPVGLFPSADGHINIAASGNHMYQRLCGALEAPELLEDPDFATVEDRVANREKMNDAVGAYTRRKPSTHWVERLNEAGVPCGPVYTIDKMLDDPQVQHVAMTWPADHPTLGPVSVNGNAVNIDGVPKGVRSVTPDMGEYTDELLADLGYDATAIAALRESGAV